MQSERVVEMTKPDHVGKKVSNREHLFGSSHRLRSCDFPTQAIKAIVIASMKMPVLWEGKHPVYLLSDHFWIMTRFHFERTVIGP